METLDSLVVDATQSIRQAMNVVNCNGRGICFVIQGKKLIGVVTDGDIRRALLRNSSLESSILEAANVNCFSLPVTSSSDVIRNYFNEQLKIIPLCDSEGNLVDVADIRRSHRIPLLEPELRGNEIDYVLDCLNTNWISSQGSYVRRFEDVFQSMHEGMHALAVSNGTVAIHLALHTLGITSGDEVILPNLTFAATINAVLFCGATPVLCEIDPATLCIDLQETEKLITPKTRAILPVHLYGQVCNIDGLMTLANKYQVMIVEDCAEAFGSSWKDEPVGTFGHAATFSFFGNKTITTGEGGMVLFRDQKVFERAKILRDHGMARDKKYWHEQVGFNYRLTNLQAAVGVAQLERFSEIQEKKKTIAGMYAAHLKGIDKIRQLPMRYSYATNSNWLYTIILEPELDRDLIISQMLESGIETRPVFYPLHDMPPYKDFKKSQCLKHSSSISRSGISLPSSVSLTESEIKYIAGVLFRLIK